MDWNARKLGKGENHRCFASLGKCENPAKWEAPVDVNETVFVCDEHWEAMQEVDHALSRMPQEAFIRYANMLAKTVMDHNRRN